MNIKMKIANHLISVPQNAYGSNGYDLRANIQNPIFLTGGSRVMVPTGIFIELPENVCVQILPRSGLAFNNGITVLNSPGLVDWNYRDEIKVILINHSAGDFKINNGDRVAQMIFVETIPVKFELVEQLSDSDRGLNGIGSSGVK